VAKSQYSDLPCQLLLCALVNAGPVSAGYHLQQHTLPIYFYLTPVLTPIVSPTVICIIIVPVIILIFFIYFFIDLPCQHLMCALVNAGPVSAGYHLQKHTLPIYFYLTPVLTPIVSPMVIFIIIVPEMILIFLYIS
jgi:hypothetical protein